MMTILRLLPGLAAFLALACGGDSTGPHVNGGGVETTNTLGIARYPDDRPAAGAVVRLRPKDYLSSDSRTVSKVSAAGSNSENRLPEVMADSNGRFRFDSVSLGTYRIEIHDGKSQGALLEFSVSKSSPEETHLSAVLEPTATVSGSVALAVPEDSSVLWVQVYGLERLSLVRKDGSFTVSEMPRGSHELRILSSDPDYASKDRVALQVESGGQVDLAPVPLALLPCGDRACDSLMVFLMAKYNGRDTVNMHVYFPVDSGRITALNMSLSSLVRRIGYLGRLSGLRHLNLHGSDMKDYQMPPLFEALGQLPAFESLILDWNALTTLPPALANLRHLKKLSLEHNPLTSLPSELGQLHSLESLNVNQGLLTILPDIFGGLPELKVFYANDNELTDLPPSFFGLENLLLLDIQLNRLCSFTIEEASWLQVIQRDFLKSQTCN